MLRQLVEEWRNTVRGLRIRHLEPDELERAISLIPRVTSGSRMKSNSS